MTIRHSQEDYLEAILVLSRKKLEVRSVDIAVHMGFSKASVSRAMAQLLEGGLIEMDDGKRISLTETGRQMADKVYEKHLFFKEVLKDAGVDEAQAGEEACRIEHAISDDAFNAFRQAFGKNDASKQSSKQSSKQ